MFSGFYVDRSRDEDLYSSTDGSISPSEFVEDSAAEEASPTNGKTENVNEEDTASRKNSAIGRDNPIRGEYYPISPESDIDQFGDDNAANCDEDNENNGSGDLEQLFSPIKNDQQRNLYVDAFDADYPRYLQLYHRLRPKVVEIVRLRDQLGSMPKAMLDDDNRRRKMAEELRSKYAALGYGNDSEQEIREYLRLAGKIRFLKRRVKEYDQKRAPVASEVDVNI